VHFNHSINRNHGTMQAILKRKHSDFCTMIQDIRISRSLPAADLAVMQSELCTIFEDYQERLNELRTLIREYEAKNKAIRIKLKQMVREGVSKNSSKVKLETIGK